jgi:hydroxymethylpyrimidine/phosphomethylpyrimidine kinase
MKKTVLTIAGSDPSGNAGAQADLRTLTDLGLAGISAITAITAQNDKEVISIHPTPADVLTQQISTACREQNVLAVKIGMVATKANARAIAWFLKSAGIEHIVIDPVLHSSSGTPLLEANAIGVYRQQLLPLATVITPNLSEASFLAGMQVASLETMRIAAEIIHRDLLQLSGKRTRPLAIIVKGGHLEGDAIDLLFDGEKYQPFQSPRIPANPRGTGCRFASAIAAQLAKGDSLPTAIARAKEYMSWYISKAVM